jgi:hypothetical protein
MFSALIFGNILCASIHVSIQQDTVPKARDTVVGTEGERESNEVQQVFHDHYISGNYPLFDGPITRIALGTYRFDAFTMRMDSMPNEMIGLLSRGLLYPRLFDAFGSTDTLSIANLSEIKGLSAFPQKRRFTCWVFSRRQLNPTWYVFELTNELGTRAMSLVTFIQDARLTFLYQVGIII